MALLQNALKDIPELSIVEIIDEYTSTTSGNGSFTHLNYSSYYNLLINACVRYDATNTSTSSRRRNVYAAAGTQDVTLIEDPTNPSSLKTYTHHQMTSIKYIKSNIAKGPQNYSLVSRGILPKRPPLLHLRCLLKNTMALSMFLQMFTTPQP